MAHDLLRFTTAGSVDDGKSTLIGRLLLDSKAILEDQMAAIERASKQRGDPYLDLALLTDGLRAEREQAITIDVAYRYFSTPRRKFIIADTPGHVQYTRNMVTGASTATLAVILIDARKGVVTQSKRHGFLASLLGIPHILVAVNKMDLVHYSQEVFEAISQEYRAFASKLVVHDMTFVPISALRGDNVVSRSAKMPWYEGPPLIQHLEQVSIGGDRNLVDFRFPVQYVIRPHQDFRGFAGQVASGSISRGAEVVVLPSGNVSRIRKIVTFAGELEEAAAGDSAVIVLEDEIDVTRGDMIVRRRNLPEVTTSLDCILCCMTDKPVRPGGTYLLRHTTRSVPAQVAEITYRINMDTLHREPAGELRLNEIGRLRINTAQPLFFDPYQINRATGGFILIDPYSNNTVAAGIIRREAQDLEEIVPSQQERRQASNVVTQPAAITLDVREQRNGHGAAVIWFTGLSGSGKTTIAHALEKRLFAAGAQVFSLDGDNLRHGLNRDLGFSALDRKENIRRTAEVARLLFDSGSIVLCTFISPFRDDRAFARSLLPTGRFVEVFVKCPIEICEERDPKGLYVRARRGEIPDFTGISSPYEEPLDPEWIAETNLHTTDHIVEALLGELHKRGIVRDLRTLDASRPVMPQ